MAVAQMDDELRTTIARMNRGRAFRMHFDAGQASGGAYQGRYEGARIQSYINFKNNSCAKQWNTMRLHMGVF